jgi:hypothetical protein
MVLVKVLGGLGNQMFQVAYAKMIALEYNEEIYLDISVYNKYKIRNYSISNLKISNSLKYIEDSNLSMAKKLYLNTTRKVYHLYQKIAKETTSIDKYGKIPFALLSKKGLYYNFDRYYYNFSPNNAKVKSIYGYFQSEKYFEKYKSQVIEELKVKTPPTDREQSLLEEIKSCNAVAISMRLGDDYINSPSLNVCKEDFYYRGMDYIYNQNKDVVFYIFSDSIELAKKHYKFKYPVRYIEGFKDYESLRLLYSCKHFVISNSSFSWWGAYLAEGSNKIIVAPNRWYNDTKEKPDIYHDKMILLEV